jgi:hypothetical protein
MWTKNRDAKKSKPDHKIGTLNVFKKSFKEVKDEKRLKDIKETKEGTHFLA